MFNYEILIIAIVKLFLTMTTNQMMQRNVLIELYTNYYVPFIVIIVNLCSYLFSSLLQIWKNNERLFFTTNCMSKSFKWLKSQIMVQCSLNYNCGEWNIFVMRLVNLVNNKLYIEQCITNKTLQCFYLYNLMYYSFMKSISEISLFVAPKYF